MHFFVQVWAYELLALNRFTIHAAPRAVPFMILWSDDRRVFSGYHRHHSLAVLQRLLGERVNEPIYYPWEDTANLWATTRERTAYRYKLVAPVADCLYLGERVSRQWGPGLDAYVPHDPPATMLSDGGPGPMLPEPAMHFMHAYVDYSEFVSTRLSLPIGEPPAEPLRGSSSSTPGWKTQIRIPRADGSSRKETIEEGKIPEKYRLPPTQKTVFPLVLLFWLVVGLPHSLTCRLPLQVEAGVFTRLHKQYMGLMDRYRESIYSTINCRCKNATQVVESTSSSSGGSRSALRRSKRAKRRS